MEESLDSFEMMKATKHDEEMIDLLNRINDTREKQKKFTEKLPIMQEILEKIVPIIEQKYKNVGMNF